MRPIEDWAEAEVVNQPGGVVTKDEARASWVAWCSEERLRPGPGTGMSKAIVAAGGRARQKPTRWEHVALRPLADSGYRVGNPEGATWTQAGWSVPGDPTKALRALQGAGLVTDRDELNRAWLELVL